MKKLLVLLLALSWPGLTRADAVLDWNKTATSAGFAAGLDNSDGCVDPLHESRIFAMMHAAIHDALNAIERRFQMSSGRYYQLLSQLLGSREAVAYDPLVVLRLRRRRDHRRRARYEGSSAGEPPSP